ncbi:MAG: flagellin, partial [Actinomycetia bacterium]|nr:flagellin [Actinomycetes bacterium]
GNTTAFGDTKLLNGSYGVSSANAVGYSATAGHTIAAANDTFDIDVNGTGAVVVTLDQAAYATGADLAANVEQQIKSALNGGTAAQAAHADNVSVSAESAGVGFNLTIDVDGLADTESFALGANGETFLSGLSFGATTAAAGTGGVFQVGANNTGDDQLNVSIAAVSATDLSLAPLDLTTDAASAIDAIDLAIASVSGTRGDLGAVQNRLESTISNLQVTSENLAASESRIRDTDVAAEMVEFTRTQILQQAGTAMLGQANAIPQSVLRLLG